MMNLKMTTFNKLFLFFLISANVNSATVKDMNKRIKNIDQEIEQKNTRIKAIDTETSQIEKKIKDTEVEIEKMAEERKEIEEEITVVKKNIDYGRKNLEISVDEHDRKESEFIAKIIAWDKYSKVHRRDLPEKVVLIKNYREVLYGDLQRMGYIEKVTGNIKENQDKIEAEKTKLDKLENQLKENARRMDAKKEEQIKELQDFIARFSANASKSKQATSRKKMLDKITLDDIQPSSRRYPFVGFTPEREIGNDLLQVENVSVTIDGKKILDNISFNLTKDDKVAFIADSDITTTTLFKVIMGEITPDTGSVRWGVTTSQAYLPKDNSKDFEEPLTILDWLRQFAGKEEDDNTFLRSFLGRMLFSGEEVLKPVNVLSGGEKVRVMLSKLMLSKANVLVLDDPTNHLDLESITALNDGLMAFTGSILFASHDHQFIQTLANRIIAVSDKGVIDRAETTYDEFLENPEIQKQMDVLFSSDY